MISLPSKGVEDMQNVFVSGWGSLSEDNKRAHPILQGVYLTVIPYQKCKELLGRFSSLEFMMFCAGKFT